MSTLSPQSKGGLALFAAAGIYGIFGVFIRELAHMFGAYSQVAARLAVALGIIVLINMLRRRMQALPRYDIVPVVGAGVVFALSVICFTVSVGETKVATTVFLLYVGSIFTSLVLGTWLLREKLTLVKGLAVGFAIVGLAVYAGPAVSLSVGMVTGLLSGVTDGIAAYFRKRIQTTDRSVVIMYQLMASMIVAVAACVVSGEVLIHGFAWSSIVVLLVFAALIVGLNYFLLYGFKYFDVNVGTILLSTELFFALIFGFLFLGEQPTPYELIGGLCIFTASILAFVDVGALANRLKTARAGLK